MLWPRSQLIYLLVRRVFFYDFALSLNGLNMDLYSVGTVLYMCIVMTVTGKIALISRCALAPAEQWAAMLGARH